MELLLWHVKPSNDGQMMTIMTIHLDSSTSQAIVIMGPGSLRTGEYIVSFVISSSSSSFFMLSFSC